MFVSAPTVWLYWLFVTLCITVGTVSLYFYIFSEFDLI